jgi:hypothetical protein
MTTGYDHKRQTLAAGASLVLAAPTMDGNSVRTFGRFGNSVALISGTQQVQKLQFVAQASMNDGDNVILYDEDGQGWGFWTNQSGAAVEPSYAAWDLLDSDHKIEVDISGDTTADQVATNFRAARLGFSASPAFNEKFSASVVSAGAWDATNEFPANGYIKTVTMALVKNSDGTTDGAISTANVAPGANGFVDPTNDKFKSVAHGFALNDVIQISTDDTLPSGLTASTDYFVNPVNADEFELYDAAIPGGNLLDLGTFGLGTQTIFTPLAYAVVVEGSMVPQGTPDAYWNEVSNVPFSANNFVGDSSPWPYVQAKVTVTNNGSYPIAVDIGFTSKA